MQRLTAEMGAATLDGLAAALFLVDGQAGIAYSNARAREMLSDADTTAGASSSRLALFDSEANRTLRGAIADASAGDAAVASQAIARAPNIIEAASGAQK